LTSSQVPAGAYKRSGCGTLGDTFEKEVMSHKIVVG